MFVYLALPLLIVGCKEGRTLIPVTGKVTFEEKVVPNGKIVFLPSGGGRSARGSIQSDGTYQLSSFEHGDGIAPGTYKVTITAIEEPKIKQEASSGRNQETINGYAVDGVNTSQKPAKLKYIVPIEYSYESETPLTATVDDSTTEINFDLPVK
ncbi:MAG: hypothetical protein RH917_00920 [Lacipirellulaceae bacterium]